MPVYYSPSTKGFYDTDVLDYLKLPDDIIEISRDEHKYYITQLNNNSKTLVLDEGSLQLTDDVIKETWQSIRNTRNLLLDETDHTQTHDYPGDKEKWKKYRQILRDIPQTFSSPDKVVWPTKPK